MGGYKGLANRTGGHSVQDQVYYVYKQLECIRRDLGYETSLNYDPLTGILTSTYVDGSQRTTDINAGVAFEGAWQDIEDLRAANQLKVGSRYIINDFKTEYYIENSMTGEIIIFDEVIQETVGYAYFPNRLDPRIPVGQNIITVTELPNGYVGPINVGDITSLSEKFGGDSYYVKFANGMQTLIGIKFRANLDRFNINTSFNGQIILDDNGKVVMKPEGVINTEVHDGTPYMDMTSDENLAVPTEKIILTAIATDTFSVFGESLTFLGDKLEYIFTDTNILNDNGAVIGQRKGRIQRRENADLQIDVDYDWRVQRFRRYQIDNIDTWNNYRLQNSVDSSLYQINGINGFTITNDSNITEEHKYLLPSIEELGFYIDFTLTGTTPNPFLTGRSNVPVYRFGDRLENAEKDEFEIDVLCEEPKFAKDLPIFSLKPNYDPADNVTFFKVQVLENSVFRSLSGTYGDSGDLSVVSENGSIKNTTYTCHASTRNSGVMNKVKCLDTSFIQCESEMTNVNILSIGEIRCFGRAINVTVGGYPNTQGDGANVTYNDYTLSKESQLRNVILGGKRTDRTLLSNCFFSKTLLGGIQNQYTRFEGSTTYLTAFKMNRAVYGSIYKIGTSVNPNAKKGLYGFYFNDFQSNHEKTFFLNNLGDILYITYDGNNNNQASVGIHALSQ